MEIDAARLAEVVRTRMATNRPLLSAFWVPLSGDREDYADGLRRELAGSPAAVLVVRTAGFDNPNSILFDLMRVVEDGRQLVEAPISVAPSGPWGLVLLTRGRLSVSQASSPVALPEWFPSRAGESVSAIVEDLSLSADAALNCSELCLPMLCESLFSLEASLLRRLTEVISQAPERGQHLFDLIRRDGDTTYSALLATFRSSRNGVASPEAFRPSLRAGSSLVARLWAIGHQRNPEDGAPSKALARALALDEETTVLPRESLSTVLRRPSNAELTAPVRFARNALATLASSCQLITASAHADSYGRFPVTLLETYSYDLRRAMSDMEKLLLSMPPMGESR